MARLRPRSVRKDDFARSFSVVLCARDEGERLVLRLENLLNMDYPPDLMEIVVVSDGSTDTTDDVVRSFAQQRVRLIRLERPLGKAAALNAGVAASSYPLLLLCDARQSFGTDVARRLMAHFADPDVGAVSGRLCLRPASQTAAASGVGSYWNYEVMLRDSEAASGSVVGVTGAIYAMRRELWTPLPPGTILDDVLAPMRVVLAGKRVVYDTDALAVDSKPVHDAGELTRKVRTLLGNLQLIQLAPELLSPWRNPIWFRFVSHKMARLFLPAMLAGCLVTSLAAGGWLAVLGVAQLAFWIAAIAAWRFGWQGFPWRAMAGLLLLNAAVVRAWMLWIRGRYDVWDKASSHDANARGQGTRP
ncbi:glycosyltransferase [Fundidesulfovibrio magnetotacticus]|nr:glycosyltransferase [Fundidesulfovibrio magnetotacticus]